MYQVNYSGLKKRESYDEIVAIIEGDQTKVRYPNRVAMQIMNSPYMRQLEYEAVMDVPAGQVGEAENEGHGAPRDRKTDGHPACSAQSPARPEPNDPRRATGSIRQRLSGGVGGPHERLQG